MNQPVDHITKTAAHLSLVEVVLGSIVHGLKLPFGGHSLSLNQGFFLLRHVQKELTYRAPIEISAIAAVLKSLSPAGQKIGPMLSISMQGLLFSIGLFIGQGTAIGQILGMLLLSLWAFIQPFITLYIIHGSQLNKILEFYTERVRSEYPTAFSSIWIFILMLIALKMTLALIVYFSTRLIEQKKLDQFEQKLIDKALKINQSQKTEAMKNKTTFQKILKDLTRPLFLFSMLLLVGFLFLTETDYVKIFWQLLRPFAIAIIFFYFARSEKFHQLLARHSPSNKYLNFIHIRAQATKKYLDQLAKNLS